MDNKPIDQNEHVFSTEQTSRMNGNAPGLTPTDTSRSTPQHSTHDEHGKHDPTHRVTQHIQGEEVPTTGSDSNERRPNNSHV